MVKVESPPWVVSPRMERVPSCAVVVKRLVLEATVEKKLVEVAFARVVPACAVRLPEIVRVEVAVMAPPKNAVPEMYELPWTEKVAAGVVVLIPTLPPLVAKYAEPIELICVVEACPSVVRPVMLSVEAPVIAPLK